MTARHHHFLSQCYLKGFTDGGHKKSKLTVFDMKELKVFKTLPRGVCGIRDFNRLNLSGLDPNIIENRLSAFESKVATSIKQLIESKDFSGEVKDIILNFICLLALRNPSQREYVRHVHEQIVEVTMGMILKDKELWGNQVEQMREDGLDISGASYESMKVFFEEKKYSLSVNQNYLIGLEFERLDTLLPYLHNRRWLLLESKDKSWPFITTDLPVYLKWTDSDMVPPIYRNNPGFGFKNTEVMFPLSQNLLLFGEFDGREGVFDAPNELVATVNSKMLLSCHRQAYAPLKKIPYMNNNNEVVNNEHFNFSRYKPFSSS